MNSVTFLSEGKTDITSKSTKMWLFVYLIWERNVRNSSKLQAREIVEQFHRPQGMLIDSRYQTYIKRSAVTCVVVSSNEIISTLKCRIQNSAHPKIFDTRKRHIKMASQFLVIPGMCKIIMWNGRKHAVLWLPLGAFLLPWLTFVVLMSEILT